MTQVYFIGAGPGNPELMTIKGQKIIDRADIIFAHLGFLSVRLFDNKKIGCEILDPFKLPQGEKLEIIEKALQNGKTAAFVNHGDSCLFGAVRGMGDRLEKRGIEYEVIPGISAFNASTAIIQREMTGLGMSNTAICTTWKDRPDAEEYLDRIAALQASVALFMSVEKIDMICDIFRKHYPEETAVAVVSKASQPEQKIASGTLATIASVLKEKEIYDGLILVGDFIDKEYDYEVERLFMERKREKFGEIIQKERGKC